MRRQISLLFCCYTRVKTHNLLQVVNRRKQCCSEQAWTVLCCTLWTLLSTVLFRPVRTALFRADEPTGVNNAVLTVHIKHDSNPVLCCVNRFEKGCWNSTYHAWYQYCFISWWIYNLFFFHGLRDYFLYYRGTKIHSITSKKFIIENKWSYIKIQPTERLLQARSLNTIFLNYWLILAVSPSVTSLWNKATWKQQLIQCWNN